MIEQTHTHGHRSTPSLRPDPSQRMTGQTPIHNQAHHARANQQEVRSSAVHSPEQWSRQKAKTQLSAELGEESARKVQMVTCIGAVGEHAGEGAGHFSHDIHALWL